MQALTKLKTRKAGGKSGVLPELILHGGVDLWDRMLEVMQKVWEEDKLVRDWQDAVDVPIPKKGDLKQCDHWCGISLLDVVGKVLGRIVQGRLQVVAEKILPESQSGFRKGRGCADMIFVARQLVEKVREHGKSLYMLFVDLRNAYDSVPRQALWKVLEKYGVPEKMLNVVKSFHEGMHAEVRVGSTVTDRFEVWNGLRQGCTLAPTLFNIYFSAMVADWRNRSSGAGVSVLYKHGRKLVGDRTAKSRLSEMRVTESQFADDVALYATFRDSFESVAAEFVKVTSEWGLTVSTEKTKGMVVGEGLNESDVRPVQVEGGSVDVVQDFTHLGANISRDGEITSEVTRRIARAARAFGCLRLPVFKNKDLSLATKRAVYRAVVLAVLLYGAETWTMKVVHTRCLNYFYNRCIQTILGVTRYQQWNERLTSWSLSHRFGLQHSISDIILEQRLRWLGHVGRMDEERLLNRLLFGELNMKRPCHGAKKRWRDVLKVDLQAIGVYDRWYELCRTGRGGFICV